MPIISRFLGISASMYYLDHDPPHFHVAYGGFRATVGIRDGVVRGQFPRRAAAHAREWLALHRAELETNWERARRREPLFPITPLE
ncbi:MAG TPA: DUF4160 domain-containing protein [Gemmatimonadaceae bacterium]|nr:DUF4160 domain-containing protein [Gemmatimonadaceae bacterium]